LESLLLQLTDCHSLLISNKFGSLHSSTFGTEETFAARTSVPGIPAVGLVLPIRYGAAVDLTKQLHSFDMRIGLDSVGSSSGKRALQCHAGAKFR
jgi:hypothetical protein